MGRSRKLEETLGSLQSARQGLPSEGAIAIVRQVLQSKLSIAVAQAAKIVGDAELYDLKPELVQAFDRFMVKPEQTDPGCKAKERLAETLYRFEFSDERLFLQGIRHVQMEPTWGTTVDTAASLRGICALGLVRMNYPQVMIELADLLADAEPTARVNAAKAIAYTANREAVPLLRFKVHIGDSHPDVLAECFAGLLNLDPDASLELVADCLNAGPEPLRETAVLALGESKLEAALPLIRTAWQRSRSREFQRVALMAIAMLRQDAAIDFLLDLVAKGSRTDSEDAFLALKLYEHETALWQRVEQAQKQRA